MPKTDAEVVQDDLREALRLLGYPDYDIAQPRSPHAMFQEELLPRLQGLVAQFRENRAVLAELLHLYEADPDSFNRAREKACLDAAHAALRRPDRGK